MKKLVGLDQKLTKPKNEFGEIPTYGDVIADCLLYAHSQNGVSSIRCLKLGSRIIEASGEILLEDADFELAKSATNSNPRRYFNWVHGQVMQKFDEWERVDC